jgi:hypothetical protein
MKVGIPKVDLHGKKTDKDKSEKRTEEERQYELLGVPFKI